MKNMKNCQKKNSLKLMKNIVIILKSYQLISVYQTKLIINNLKQRKIEESQDYHQAAYMVLMQTQEWQEHQR